MAVNNTLMLDGGSARNVSTSTDFNNYANLMTSLTDKTNALTLQSARETNAFNAAEAQKQRDWEEMMSNTAISRRMNDLAANGINKILAVMNGNGAASTPSGSSAHGTNPSFANAANALASLVGSMVNTSTNLKIAELNAKNAYKMNQEDNKTALEVANANNKQDMKSSTLTNIARYGNLMANMIRLTMLATAKKGLSKDYNSKGEYWPGGEEYWITHGLK